MKREILKSCPLQLIPNEVQVSIFTYLRSKDLASLQETCHQFNTPHFISQVIHYTATQLYPIELTQGFDHIVRGNPTPKDANGYFTNYEPIRNMEILVVARVLSRPEPPPHERSHSFYVSKAWCKSALQYLESQQPPPPDATKTKKGKKETKKARMRSRKLCRIVPPLPNATHDLTCPHGDLRHCSTKAAKARRRIMDKQAWKVLKKLYPDSVPLRALQMECWQCAMEAETSKKQLEKQKEAEMLERRKPLSHPLIRGIYTRANKGVPLQSLHSLDTKLPPSAINSAGNGCPLIPGVYSAIPRSWCHKWRKYCKSGGERPTAPDSSSLLCDAHKLPLVPNHLEAFLSGETPSLLCASVSTNANANININTNVNTIPSPSSPRVVGMARASSSLSLENDGISTDESFLSAGIFGLNIDTELQQQRQALHRFQLQNDHLRQQRQLQLQQQNHIRTLQSPDRERERDREYESPSKSNNDRLDQENQVVVEIITEEECIALEEYWPDIHTSFMMKFAVTCDDNVITWSTTPCRECDAGHCGTKILERNRNRNTLERNRNRNRNKNCRNRSKRWKR